MRIKNLFVGTRGEETVIERWTLTARSAENAIARRGARPVEMRPHGQLHTVGADIREEPLLLPVLHRWPRAEP
jgi:hypothetical protein